MARLHYNSSTSMIILSVLMLTMPMVKATAISDQNALLTLHASLNGSKWFNTWPVTGSSDPCINNWYGVSCVNINSVMRIQSINLDNNNLIGAIPNNVFENLTALNSLSLAINTISGPIPNSIKSCSNLTYLDLSSNVFSNTIPDIFSTLPKLVQLKLNDNTLTGNIPTSLATSNLLVNINLSRNSLNGTIPNIFSTFLSLKTLDISDNMISGGIVPTLTSCTKLAKLNIANNLFFNAISQGLFTNFVQLEYLNLANNNFSGAVPSSIKNCISLKYLSVNSNSFVTLNDIFAPLTNLTTADVGGNPYTRALPASLFNSPSISELIISDINTLPILTFTPHPKVFSLDMTNSPSFAVNITLICARSWLSCDISDSSTCLPAGMTCNCCSSDCPSQNPVSSSSVRSATIVAAASTPIATTVVSVRSSAALLNPAATVRATTSSVPVTAQLTPAATVRATTSSVPVTAQLTPAATVRATTSSVPATSQVTGRPTTTSIAFASTPIAKSTTFAKSTFITSTIPIALTTTSILETESTLPSGIALDPMNSGASNSTVVAAAAASGVVVFALAGFLLIRFVRARRNSNLRNGKISKIEMYPETYEITARTYPASMHNSSAMLSRNLDFGSDLNLARSTHNLTTSTSTVNDATVRRVV